MKIIIFTADDHKGGITQFAFRTLESAINNGWEATLYIPNVNDSYISSFISDHIVRYEKTKSIFGWSSKIKEVAYTINSENPDIIFFCDEAIFSIQMLRYINNNILKILTIHDVNTHPSYFNIRRFLVYGLWILWRRCGFKLADRICLLSDYSANLFSRKYKNYSNKIVSTKLPAHPPKVDSEIKPKEIVDKRQEEYFLFFGRIEKYKGVRMLVSAYNRACNIRSDIPKLIIAGNGTLQKEEQDIILKNNRICLINRFIEDTEMIWLFKHSIALITPYTEASQSGVVPMAYHFGKPILSTSIGGLEEYIVDEITGFRFNKENELTSIFLDNDITERLRSMQENCFDYEANFLNWDRNLYFICKK